jgi:hypothetical protein
MKKFIYTNMMALALLCGATTVFALKCPEKKPCSGEACDYKNSDGETERGQCDKECKCGKI